MLCNTYYLSLPDAIELHLQLINFSSSAVPPISCLLALSHVVRAPGGGSEEEETKPN